jgi:hypothetical protein
MRVRSLCNHEFLEVLSLFIFVCFQNHQTVEEGVVAHQGSLAKNFSSGIIALIPLVLPSKLCSLVNIWVIFSITTQTAAR